MQKKSKKTQKEKKSSWPVIIGFMKRKRCLNCKTLFHYTHNKTIYCDKCISNERNNTRDLVLKVK